MRLPLWLRRFFIPASAKPKTPPGLAKKIREGNLPAADLDTSCSPQGTDQIGWPRYDRTRKET